MLAKKYRFIVRGQSAFFQEATKQRVHSFLVLSNKNDSGFAVTCRVPKKVAALSTQRNKLKRLVYQEIQKKLTALQVCSVSVVLIVQRPILPTQVHEQMMAVVTQLQQQYAIRA